MDAPVWFIPDRDQSRFYPLRSFLSQPPASVVEAYLDALTAPGDLVVDPFASTPTVAHVAQTMGRRVIAVQSNPLWIWLARVMAALPPAADIDAALAHLGDTPKDDTSLRTHIDQLYATTCAGCHQLTPADYNLWSRGQGPTHRHYTCVHCGETHLDPATEQDLRRAAEFDGRGFHSHFAFERVAPVGGLYGERVRKILDLYTPRNLYALVTLTVKIDTLFHEREERNLLLLLLLHLLDRGSSFYTDPSPQAQPQLTSHKEFVEFNLWSELERAARALGETAPEFRVDLSPSTTDVIQGDTPRAFMNRGSTRALARAIPEHTAACILTTLPQRRLAVWALSYFWGAWVLGRAAVTSLVPSLDAHVGDPNWERRWYLDLLAGSMNAAAKLLHSEGRAAFIFGESWNEVIEALLLAASGAGFELDSLLFQPQVGDMPRREFDSLRGDYRVTFAPGAEAPKLLPEPELVKRIRAAALDAGREVLARRGQPLAYSWVHHAAYAREAREGYLAQAMHAGPKMIPGRFVSSAVREGLSEGYAHDLDHYEAADQFLWFRRGGRENLNVPLIDRVDDAVHELLSRAQSLPHAELEDALYHQFPGDLTPEAGLVELCAQAYADLQQASSSDARPQSPEGEGAPALDPQAQSFDRACVWHWRREAEAPLKSHALDVLARLGERLQFRVGQVAPFDLTWEADGEIAHGFVWRERAVFADLAQIQVAPMRGYLIVPEVQVPLLSAKLRHLPTLAEAYNEAGWGWMRVPFVEKLLEQEKIERHDLLLITGLVPPVAAGQTQLELF